jgi:hypothetical protein
MDGLLDRQDHAPEAPAKLLDAPWEESPRPALNAASLLRSWGGGRLFFHAFTARVPARSTTRRANAHMAGVLCRYPPVQLRTS